MRTILRQCGITTIILVSTTLRHYSYANAEACKTEDAVNQTLYSSANRIGELATAQRAQAAEIQALLKARSEIRQWSETHYRNVVNQFLTSPAYIALEQERTDHKKQIESFKQKLRSAKTSTDLRAACLLTPAVLNAIEASFSINTRQVEVARAEISHAE